MNHMTKELNVHATLYITSKLLLILNVACEECPDYYIIIGIAFN